MSQQPWTTAELEQFRAFIKNFHIICNSMPNGTRMLLEAHGFGRGKIHGLKRNTYKLNQALKAVLTAPGGVQ